MKLELTEKEPLILLLVMSAVPPITICLSMWTFVHLSQHDPLPAPQVEVRVTPRVEAVLPSGAVIVKNEVPAAQIHEIVREVVKVPEVHIRNEIQAQEHPKITPVTQGKEVVLPPLSAPPRPARKIEVEEVDEYGRRLPDPQK